MNRNQNESDAWELDYECSYRSAQTPKACRELSGTEKKNRAARYSHRPSRSSQATQGIHRRGQRRQAA